MTKFVCDVHGDMGNTIGVMIDIRVAPGFSLPPGLKRFAGNDGQVERRYCYACWIEHMDTNLLPLKEISE